MQALAPDVPEPARPAPSPVLDVYLSKARPGTLLYRVLREAREEFALVVQGLERRALAAELAARDPRPPVGPAPQAALSALARFDALVARCRIEGVSWLLIPFADVRTEIAGVLEEAAQALDAAARTEALQAEVEALRRRNEEIAGVLRQRNLRAERRAEAAVEEAERQVLSAEERARRAEARAQEAEEAFTRLRDAAAEQAAVEEDRAAAAEDRAAAATERVAAEQAAAARLRGEVLRLRGADESLLVPPPVAGPPRLDGRRLRGLVGLLRRYVLGDVAPAPRGTDCPRCGAPAGVVHACCTACGRSAHTPEDIEAIFGLKSDGPRRRAQSQCRGCR